MNRHTQAAKLSPDTSNLPERPRITISGDGVVTSTAADVINTKIGRAQLEALDELIRQGLFGGEERSDSGTAKSE